MAIVAEPARSATRRVELEEQRIVLQGVSWETFLRLVEETGDDRRSLVAFNRGVLEIMSPGMRHEGEKCRAGRLVSILAEELEIAHKGYGSTTWKRKKSKKGIEPDECFYFDRKKMTRARNLLVRGEDDTSKYPGPDLAIEIDHRRSAVDRAEIYATLKVIEVWRFDGREHRIDRLGPDGTYHPVESSGFLSITRSEIAGWLLEDEENDSAWSSRLRAWARVELVGRARTH